MEPVRDVTLKRDCPAVGVPYGESLTLPRGGTVRLTQSLGGSFTVVTEEGRMARIDGREADALGLEPPKTGPRAVALDVRQEEVEKGVWEQLKTVFDPEIPVNIVDLGLVYDLKVEPHPEGGYRVAVKMTLTAPGCGMGDVLRVDGEQKILTVAGVREARVDLVVDPPWDRSMMSEAAKLQLGLM